MSGEQEAVADCSLQEPGDLGLHWFESDSVWNCVDSTQPCAELHCAANAVAHCDNCWLWHCLGHLGACGTCGRGPFCPVCATPINHTCIPRRPVPQDIYGFDAEPSITPSKKWTGEATTEARGLLANRGEELAVEPLYFYAMGKKYDIATMEEVRPPGLARRLPKKAPGKAGPSKEGEKRKEDDDDESLVWVSLEKTDRCPIGDVISDRDVKVSLGERGIARISSSEFFVRRVTELDAKAALKEILRALSSDWRDGSFIDDDIDSRVPPISPPISRW